MCKDVTSEHLYMFWEQLRTAYLVDLQNGTFREFTETNTVDGITYKSIFTVNARDTVPVAIFFHILGRLRSFEMNCGIRDIESAELLLQTEVAALWFSMDLGWASPA